MLNVAPNIDGLDRKFGFITGGSSQDYILLGLPFPISGPVFEKHGTYAVRVFL